MINQTEPPKLTSEYWDGFDDGFYAAKTARNPLLGMATCALCGALVGLIIGINI